jgi:hypothetical protein
MERFNCREIPGKSKKKAKEDQLKRSLTEAQAKLKLCLGRERGESKAGSDFERHCFVS